MSWIEVRLSPDADGGTRLELEHIARPDEHWDQFGPGAVGIGWDMAFMGLALYLATGVPNDVQESMAWMGSDDGKEFITQSSDRWRDADIASGTDAADAGAKAERTTAAYTAPAPEAAGGAAEDAGETTDS
jgi:hypothetical protein